MKNELVFLEPNKIDAIPFTTSDVIAEYAQIKHHAVQQMIAKHENSLKVFGQVAFEMRAVQYARGTNQEKIYHLNEQQATLLITFLRNTDPVIKFKTELVRQFYAMRSELQQRQINRQQLKPIRRELTDVIQETGHSKWSYKDFTDLAYKTVTGMTASKLRIARGAKPKAVAIDYMTSSEISGVSKAEYQIAVLVDMGMSYTQIKSMLSNRYLTSAAS